MPEGIELVYMAWQCKVLALELEKVLVPVLEKSDDVPFCSIRLFTPFISGTQIYFLRLRDILCNAASILPGFSLHSKQVPQDY